MRISAGKIVASAIGLTYLVLAMVRPAWHGIFLSPFCPFLALALIWFAEPLGELTGVLPSAGVTLDRPSTGIAVTLVGWLILLGWPLVMALVAASGPP